MTRNPVLTEAVIRAWALDDPRVLSHLRAENQPGRYQRTNAVEARAKAADWPAELGFANADAKKAGSEAMRRLEGHDYRRGRGSLTLAEREEVDECIAALAATS